MLCLCGRGSKVKGPALRDRDRCLGEFRFPRHKISKTAAEALPKPGAH